MPIPTRSFSPCFFSASSGPLHAEAQTITSQLHAAVDCSRTPSARQKFKPKGGSPVPWLHTYSSLPLVFNPAPSVQHTKLTERSRTPPCNTPVFLTYATLRCVRLLVHVSHSPYHRLELGLLFTAGVAAHMPAKMQATQLLLTDWVAFAC